MTVGGPTPLQVRNQTALQVDLLSGSMTVKVVAGDTVYYADQPYVNATDNQGSIALNASATFTTPVWLKSASNSSVTVTQLLTPGQDIVLGSDGMVGGPGGTALTSPVGVGIATANATAANRKRERNNTTLISGTGASQCWFNGPPVIDHSGAYTKRYTGWTDSTGSIIVQSTDQQTGETVQTNLHAGYVTGGTTANDHCSPALAVTPSGRILVFYAQQSGDYLRYRISTNPEDVSAFQTEQTLTAMGNVCTYPRPFYIGSRLFLACEGGGCWRIIYSDDDGATWGTPRVWFSAVPDPPLYVILHCDGSRMDWITSLHPNQSNAGYTSLSNMVHGSFDGTTFHDSTGASIGTLAGLPVITLPNTTGQTGGVSISNMTTVYTYTTNGLCWAWDVALGSDGNPVCVFSSYPEGQVGDDATTVPARFADHRYNYYRWNGGAWAGAQIQGTNGDGSPIVSMGSKIGDNYLGFQEYQYSGGLALLKSDPSVVYLSRQVKPRRQFEIERWVTTDGYGASWTRAAVTTESDPLTKNIRPATAWNPTPGSSEVSWLQGYYWDYTNFSTRIALSPPPASEQGKTSLIQRPAYAVYADPLIQAALAVNPSILLPLVGDLTDIARPGLDTPQAPTLTPSGSGGTLAAGTYNYRIAARSVFGSTIAGPEATVGAVTTGTTSQVAVLWSAVPEAVSYDVYGRTAGSELLIANVTGTTYADTGSVTPSGALPTSDASGASNGGVSNTTPRFTGGNQRGLWFDGNPGSTGQYVRTRYQPCVASTIRTFFGWGWRQNSGSQMVLAASDNAGGANSHFIFALLSGNNNFKLWGNAGNGSTVTWTAAWPGNQQWAHWAVIYDQVGQTVELFVNGVSKGVQAYTVALGVTGDNFEVGARGATYQNNTISDPWCGKQRIVGCYEGALTAAQIATLAGVAPPDQSRQSLVVKARGFVTETVDFGMVNTGAQYSLTSGTTVGELAGFYLDDVVTGIATYSQAPASVTLFKVALIQKASSYNVLARSADFSASLVSGINLIPFTSPFTIPSSGAYYLMVLAVFSGTAPQILAANNNAQSLIGASYNSGLILTAQESGQSDFQTVGNAMALGNGPHSHFWLAAY